MTRKFEVQYDQNGRRKTLTIWTNEDPSTETGWAAIQAEAVARAKGQVRYVLERKAR